MSTFQERFNFAFQREKTRRKALGRELRKTDVWKAAGATSGAFTQWADGTIEKMPLDRCFLIAPVLRCNPHWLFNGTGKIDDEAEIFDLESHPDLVSVKRMKDVLSAGIDGYSVNDMSEEEGLPVFFRRDWMQSQGLKPDRLAALKVNGRSMEPSLWDGDLVVINLEDQKLANGEVFAVKHEGANIIKRLRHNAGQWWLASDNPDQIRYAPQLCAEDTLIIGRIVYKQSLVI